MAKYVMELKDWEQIKKQAEAQIKDASIVLQINTHILDVATQQIRIIDESKPSIDNTNADSTAH